MGVRRILPYVLALWIAMPLFAEEVETTTRVFQLRHSTVAAVSGAVQSLLSEHGSLTVNPHHNRITVQDTPDVVGRIAVTVEELDTPPGTYGLRIRLLRGPDERIDPDRRTEVDRRVTRMFPFDFYAELGATVIEGELTVPVTTDIGGDYRVSFTANPLQVPKNMPVGMRGVSSRFTLDDLVLRRVRDGENGSAEVIRTVVTISPGQQAVIGAGASEDSKTGLVLILEAQAVGAR
jgi:hypothetical protein